MLPVDVNKISMHQPVRPQIKKFCNRFMEGRVSSISRNIRLLWPDHCCCSRNIRLLWHGHCCCIEKAGDIFLVIRINVKLTHLL